MQLSACLLPAQLNVKGNRLGADGKAAIKEAVRGKEGFTLIIDGDAVRARARGARVGARGSHLSGGQRGGGQCGPGGPGLGWARPTRHWIGSSRLQSRNLNSAAVARFSVKAKGQAVGELDPIVKKHQTSNPNPLSMGWV